MQVRGKIIKRNTRCRRLAEQILIRWRKQQHHCFKKKKVIKREKNTKFVVNENHSLRGTHDGQKYFNGPNQNMPFYILPNKTKKVKNRSKVNNQSGF